MATEQKFSKKWWIGLAIAVITAACSYFMTSCDINLYGLKGGSKGDTTYIEVDTLKGGIKELGMTTGLLAFGVKRRRRKPIRIEFECDEPVRINEDMVVYKVKTTPFTIIQDRKHGIHQIAIGNSIATRINFEKLSEALEYIRTFQLDLTVSVINALKQQNNE